MKYIDVGQALIMSSMDQFALGYFDILGTKDRIKKDVNEAIENLWDISRALQKNTFFKLEATKIIPDPQDVICRSFTDNFLLAKKIDEIPFHAVDSVLMAIGRAIYTCLFEKYILVRGAVVVGDMHIDNIAVAGSALLDAYNLESNVCVYPRIIVDQSVMNLIPRAGATFRQFNTYFFKDYDGAICFNYLMCISPDYLKQEIPKTIEKLKARSITLPMKEQIKYEWVIRYLQDYYVDRLSNDVMMTL